MRTMRLRRLSLAGIPIDLLTMTDLLSLLDRARATRDKCLILNHNLHSLYLYHTVSDFKAYYSQASHVYIDGMPVVWLGKFAGLPARSEHRITFLDSLKTILRQAEESSWRIFYLGSRDEVMTRGLDVIKEEYPQLNISGHHGYFDKDGSQSDEVISRINNFSPDVLFVGLGMPIQERWLAEHGSKINARAILTCGASLDYIAWHAYRPPAWVGPLGLYGVFRLMSDPKRLWKRYLIEPIILLKHMFFPLMRQCLSHNLRSEGTRSAETHVLPAHATMLESQPEK
jgi:N-acetylglucosaminyldiphosphoundecaprenol N-acetyl-beta-D-mannosaminyltransferase